MLPSQARQGNPGMRARALFQPVWLLWLLRLRGEKPLKQGICLHASPAPAAHQLLLPAAPAASLLRLPAAAAPRAAPRLLRRANEPLLDGIKASALRSRLLLLLNSRPGHGAASSSTGGLLGCGLGRVVPHHAHGVGVLTHHQALQRKQQPVQTGCAAAPQHAQLTPLPSPSSYWRAYCLPLACSSPGCPSTPGTQGTLLRPAPPSACDSCACTLMLRRQQKVRPTHRVCRFQQVLWSPAPLHLWCCLLAHSWQGRRDGSGGSRWLALIGLGLHMEGAHAH